MYNLLIVEDELPVRDMIIQSVDWVKIGFNVSFAAGDGQEALGFLEDNPMDLILTDIYMPFIDGLELARRVRETNSFTKIIFLTGYNEFDFAKEAIELEASRYLLKPITREELTTVLVEVKEELDRELEQKKNLSHLKKEYELRIEYLKDKLLFDIITGNIALDRIKSASHQLKWEFSDSFYQLGVLEVVNKEEIGENQWANDYSLLHYAMYNICEEILGEGTKDKVLLGDNGKLIIVFFSPILEGFEVKSYERLSDVLYGIHHIYGMDLTGGLSTVCQNISELKYKYKEAKTATQYKVIEGINRVIVKSDIEPKSGMNYEKLNIYIQEINSCIKINQMEGIEKYLNLYFELIRFEKYNLTEVKSLLLTLVTNINDTYNQMCIQDEYKVTIDFKLVEYIYQLEDFGFIKSEISKMCRLLSSKLKQYREDEKHHLIIKAQKIILENYGEPNLDLTSISGILHVSTSYFGRVYKQFAGKTFVESLTNIRMEKSKELLKSTDLKVYEISVKVGYDDPHYFSYNFRKNIGMTPLQYRNS